MSIVLNASQNSGYEIMKKRNVFLTGNAGTGKSTLTNYFKERHPNYIVMATTGIAANNINGITVHSAFAINPNGLFPEANFLSKVKRDLLRRAEGFIIDESSMLRPDILDAFTDTFKKNGLGDITKKHFIFVGDLKQLPPVISKQEETELLSYYKDVTFMSANLFKDLKVEVVELDKVERQTDLEFIENLNLLRHSKKTSYFDKFLVDALPDKIVESGDCSGK